MGYRDSHAGAGVLKNKKEKYKRKKTEVCRTSLSKKIALFFILPFEMLTLQSPWRLVHIQWDIRKKIVSSVHKMYIKVLKLY